jgi:hypothetical protein
MSTVLKALLDVPCAEAGRLALIPQEPAQRHVWFLVASY